MDIRTARHTVLGPLRRLDGAPPLLARLVIGAVFLALLAYLVVTGPGAISLDALVARWIGAPHAAARPAMRAVRA